MHHQKGADFSDINTFAVKRLEVVEVMEISSRQHPLHDKAIGVDYEEAIQLRMDLRTGIKRRTPRVCCSLCGVPAYLMSRAEERRFLFRQPVREPPFQPRSGLPERPRESIDQHGRALVEGRQGFM